jgi:hypothetical protein
MKSSASLPKNKRDVIACARNRPIRIREESFDKKIYIYRQIRKRYFSIDIMFFSVYLNHILEIISFTG